MAKIGKNQKLSYEELEVLGVVVSKISARLANIMCKYPSKTYLKTCLKRFNSTRTKLMIKLLNEIVNNPKFVNKDYDKDLRLFLRNLSQWDAFDETKPVSEWGNKTKGLLTKEETFIMKSFTERGITENIVGKKNIENRGLKINEEGGYPSTFRLASESQRVIQILRKRKAIEFVMKSLYNSKLTFILYWYLFYSLFYFTRDCTEAEIEQFMALAKTFKPDYQETFFIKEAPQIKLLLNKFSDQELLKLTKELTAQVMNTNLDVFNQFFVIIAIFKLNRTLD